MTRGGRLLCVLLVGQLSACAIINPRIDLSSEPDVSLPSADFDGAKQNARAVEDELWSRVGSLDRFDLATRALLFGATIAGLAIGIYDGSKELLLGVGLGAATVAGSRLLLPVPARQSIYVSGAEAAGCAIDAFSLPAEAGGRVAGGDDTSLFREGGAGASTTLGGVDITRLRDRLVETNTELQGFLREADTPIAGTAEIADQRTAEVAADLEALSVATAALDASRAEKLDRAIEAIIRAVNARVSEQTVDPAAAQSAANNVFGSFVSGVVEKAQEVNMSAGRLEAVAEATSQAGARQGNAEVADTGRQTAQDAQVISGAMELILERIGDARRCFGPTLTGAGGSS